MIDVRNVEKIEAAGCGGESQDKCGLPLAMRYTRRTNKDGKDISQRFTGQFLCHGIE